jgi:hypothetical protein
MTNEGGVSNGFETMTDDASKENGLGIRVGADGSIGYIAAGKVGVRIELDQGKDFVVTVSDLQGLVDYVEAAKEQGEKGNESNGEAKEGAGERGT